MTDGDLTIHQAIGEIIAELEPVGKTGYNREQKYAFRGIDAVLQALHPLLAKYGVFIVPDVLEHRYEERTSKSGNLGHCALLHVRFTVYGPTGDSITLSTWGEGLDYSDKSTNKAMTAAFKYALFQTFAICDPAEDGDGYTPEGQRERELTPPPRSATLVDYLLHSGMTLPEQAALIAEAIGHTVRSVEEMSPDEIEIAITAMKDRGGSSSSTTEEYPW